MNRYQVLEHVGDGSFGEVTKARSVRTNEIVAIKKMKALFPSWDECLQLRELKSLRVLRHENIVQLKEVIRDKEELYFVFEFMQSSLYKVMRDLRYALASSPSSSGSQRSEVSSGHLNGNSNSNSTGTSITVENDHKCEGKPPLSAGVHHRASSPLPSGWLTEPQIKSILFQLFSGLAYMHKHGFFHRDIKPENLLCHEDTLKIADLGQAREIRSCPPFTEYVSTRWYRSPELLLRATTYNSPIDLWACGCIMAELYQQTPLFPGSSEADQLARICRVLGTPTKETWPELSQLTSSFKFPKCAPHAWKHVLPAYTSKQALRLIGALVLYDPSRRLTASQALQHRFFSMEVPRPILVCSPSSSSKKQPPSEMDDHQLAGRWRMTSGGGGGGDGGPYAAVPVLPVAGLSGVAYSSELVQSARMQYETYSSLVQGSSSNNISSTTAAATWGHWDNPSSNSTTNATYATAVSQLDSRADTKVNHHRHRHHHARSLAKGSKLSGNADCKNGGSSVKTNHPFRNLGTSFTHQGISVPRSRPWNDTGDDESGGEDKSYKRPDDSVSLGSSSAAHTERSHDHMLQDLLDELLA